MGGDRVAGVFLVLFGVGGAGVVVVATVGPFLVVVVVVVVVGGSGGGLVVVTHGTPQLSCFSGQYSRYFSPVGLLGLVIFVPDPQLTQHGRTSIRSVTRSQMSVHSAALRQAVGVVDPRQNFFRFGGVSGGGRTTVSKTQAPLGVLKKQSVFTVYAVQESSDVNIDFFTRSSFSVVRLKSTFAESRPTPAMCTFQSSRSPERRMIRSGAFGTCRILSIIVNGFILLTSLKTATQIRQSAASGRFRRRIALL